MTAAVVGGWRWHLLMPPGWVRLPADDAERWRRAVARLLDRRQSHLPRDQTATARRALTRELLGQLGDARRAGATEVHTLMELVRGLPVTAGLTVVPLPAEDGQRSLLTALQQVFADSDGRVATEAARIAGQPALRRHRRVLGPPAEGAPDGAQDWRTHLDWVVELPDGDHLVLSFATRTGPIAAELVALFDAVAGSLQLVPEPA
ncbi:MAG: hypothetical protein JWN08_3589 [Frankiales bacterium]|nr:hypothetical protein [Frankiales bacterium]